jgi:hypothetical protein
MDFRTEIESNTIDIGIHKDIKIVTVGSCFSDVLGKYLSKHKINCTVNPYGTIFNPSSIFKLLNNSLTEQKVEPKLFAEKDNIWHHYDFHSRFWSEDSNILESELNLVLANTKEKLIKSNVVIITLGTSFVYKLQESNQIVANCHKQQAGKFSKVLLSEKEIVEDFGIFYSNIKNVNSEVKIILTVSPVRHTKDTLKLNSVSKAILRSSAHSIENTFKDVSYFPSYEIMMDDLRDYRFYEKDLIHPNEIAHEYIINEFLKTYGNTDFIQYIKTIEKLNLAYNHRPINESSEKHINFLKELICKMESFNQNNDFKEEIIAISDRILNNKKA